MQGLTLSDGPSPIEVLSENDKIKINTNTWIPEVFIEGNLNLNWSFENAGSGGKKTLFNACFALALNQVATRNELPLPDFLIIDTPMKNISEDVNRGIFEAFYNYLYDLAKGPLSNTQFIIYRQRVSCTQNSGTQY